MSGVRKEQKGLLPEGHPIQTLMEEHAIILDRCSMLVMAAQNLGKARGAVTVQKLMEDMDHLSDHFKEAGKHYLREENVLFSHLAKHGIIGPPAQMQSEHNDIFAVEKRLYALVDEERPGNLTGFGHELGDVTARLSELLQAHFTRENTVIFPMSLKAVGPGEWADMMGECEKIGYCIFAPVNARVAPDARKRVEGNY